MEPAEFIDLLGKYVDRLPQMGLTALNTPKLVGRIAIAREIVEQTTSLQSAAAKLPDEAWELRSVAGLALENIQRHVLEKIPDDMEMRLYHEAAMERLRKCLGTLHLATDVELLKGLSPKFREWRWLPVPPMIVNASPTPPATPDDENEAKHSSDFASVNWFGTPHVLPRTKPLASVCCGKRGGTRRPCWPWRRSWKLPESKCRRIGSASCFEIMPHGER